jgi:hypothetical protein
LLTGIPAVGNEYMDFVTANDETYELYTQKRWDELIEAGEEILKNDIDYFYLRARLGIAFYEKGNYAKAIHHIKKAFVFNDSDPVLLEYLYYAYIFSNRYQEASRLYYKNLSHFNEKTLSLKPKTFDYLDIQGGIKFSDHQNDMGLEANNIYYAYLGASLNIKGRFFLYQYAGQLSHAFTDIFREQNFIYTSRFYFRQFEYYANGSLYMGKGWSISTAFHLIRVDVITDIYNDHYFGMSINKNLNKVRLGVQVSKARIFETNVEQIVPEIIYYPLGNSKLYFHIKNTFINSAVNDPSNNMYGLIGLKLFSKTWLEGFYAYGKAQFLSYDNGYLLYNTPDYLISRGGISLYQYFKNNVSLTLSYQQENKEQFMSGDLYTHHFVMMGLNIKF